MTAMRFVYILIAYLIAPIVLGVLALRGFRDRSHWEGFSQRFGLGSAVPRRSIWVHAVSVGETRAAQPIIERLLERHPHKAVLLTHMTPTGRETGEQLYGERVQRCYLPYDYPFAIARFLAHFRPARGLIMDTEIWFNLIHACRERAIPLNLVNARLSEKSFRRYARIRSFARAGLNELDCVAAQSPDIARRFEALGARNVHVVGNVKFDVDIPADQVALGNEWRQRWGSSRRVWIAASTREGEEALVLDALAQIRVPDLLTLIVPRHPQRFDEVAKLLEARKLAYCRRSDPSWPDVRDARVVLGDSMGEMFAYYAACDVAFVGGSLRPYGAHNLLEACALAKPVVVGPFVYNFQDAVDLGTAAGAVVQVSDPDALAAQLAQLMEDTDRRAAMGAAALAFAQTHRGAVDRLFNLLGL